ncbi:histidine kinase [Cohnella luojiensis]|uniref:Histidine kinase n=1 Tax=Cohnella luojiensis TaxID=652876 RepID=A0A4Y8M7N2_9BACL|nr:histidine kinase [Cohnella luojiensis]
MKAKRSVGTKIKIGLNFIAGLTSIGAPEKTADTLDITTLDSDGGYREFIGGFKDGGEVSISGYFDPSDLGQTALDTAFEAGDATSFEIIFPSDLGASWVFNGVVTSYSGGNAELEEIVAFEATIKVSGKPVLALTASAGLSALALTGAGGALAPTFDNGKYTYTFSGVTAASITVTATAAGHTLKLYLDGVFSSELTTAVASGAIPLTLNVAKKLTIVAQEEGKTPVIYEVVALKTA